MPPSDDRAPGLKSAYELALERMERNGIERPNEEAVSDADRERMAEARRRAEAGLAELEILHRGRLASSRDPIEREKLEEEYQLDRRRIEATRDREIDRLRRG